MDDDKARAIRIGRVPSSRRADTLAETGAIGPTATEISHELGNLLTLIAGWVQYWEEAGVITPDHPPVGRYIYDGLERIRYCFDCLNDFSGTIRRHLAVTNVNMMVRSILDALDPRVRTNYRLQVVQELAPWPVAADYRAFDIVLVSLLMNIVPLSRPGSAIVVKTANVETFERICGIDGSLAEGRYLCISIEYRQDDIDTHDLRSLLPFASVASPGPADPGTAYLSLKILEAHGALLRVDGLCDGGTVASIFLPALSREDHDS